jgi:hypothetical protein
MIVGEHSRDSDLDVSIFCSFLRLECLFFRWFGSLPHAGASKVIWVYMMNMRGSLENNFLGTPHFQLLHPVTFLCTCICPSLSLSPLVTLSIAKYILLGQVNPVSTKELTNIRAPGKDENVHLSPSCLVCYLNDCSISADNELIIL